MPRRVLLHALGLFLQAGQSLACAWESLLRKHTSQPTNQPTFHLLARPPPPPPPARLQAKARSASSADLSDDNSETFLGLTTPSLKEGGLLPPIPSAAASAQHQHQHHAQPAQQRRGLPYEQQQEACGGGPFQPFLVLGGEPAPTRSQLLPRTLSLPATAAAPCQADPAADCGVRRLRRRLSMPAAAKDYSYTYSPEVGGKPPAFSLPRMPLACQLCGCFSSHAALARPPPAPAPPAATSPAPHCPCPPRRPHPPPPATPTTPPPPLGSPFTPEKNCSVPRCARGRWNDGSASRQPAPVSGRPALRPSRPALTAPCDAHPCLFRLAGGG